MDKELENYLKTLEKYLRNMPVSERIDVINELKSYMQELVRNDSKSPSEIIAQLGSPKELAKEYLGDVIGKSTTFNLRKLMMLISFYGVTGLSGMIILPCGTVLSASLILCSIIMPIGGAIKALGFLIGIDVPFITFQLGNISLHPLLSFPVSLVLGILFFIGGKKIWRLIIKYIQKVSKNKKVYMESKLHNE